MWWPRIKGTTEYYHKLSCIAFIFEKWWNTKYFNKCVILYHNASLVQFSKTDNVMTVPVTIDNLQLTEIQNS